MTFSFFQIISKYMNNINYNDLIDYFHKGCVLPEKWGIGIEYESIGVYKDSGTAIPHSGKRSVETVLKAIMDIYNCKPVIERNILVGLESDNCRLTTEPGGQLELSGKVNSNLCDAYEEIKCHFELISEVSGKIGIYWLSIGAHPNTPVNIIEWSPKKRYSIMSKHLGARGMLAHNMMKQTAGIQVNFDYESERDAGQKLQTAMAISPIITAMFANSPFLNGLSTGYMSSRANIWEHTDPERCGLVKEVFEEDFDFSKYVDYALNVPLIFINRNNRTIPMNGIPFRQYLKQGYCGHSATIKDWEAHLTTIFTEIRLKQYIETRSADNVPFPLGMALAALWKGILYDSDSCLAAWETLPVLSWEERKKLLHNCAVYGLNARLGKNKVLHYAKELFHISAQGLLKQNCNSCLENEFLAPLKELLFRQKCCPAELLLKKWEQDWNYSFAPLPEYCQQR